MIGYAVCTPFLFFHIRRYGNISMGTPLMGASNAGGVDKNRDYQQISGCQVDDW